MEVCLPYMCTYPPTHTQTYTHTSHSQGLHLYIIMYNMHFQGLIPNAAVLLHVSARLLLSVNGLCCSTWHLGQVGCVMIELF